MPKQPKSNLSPEDFGRLQPVESDGFTISADGITSQAVDWCLNRRVLKRSPQTLHLPLQIVSDDTGFRRILPRTTLKRFLLCAAFGGRVIYTRMHSPTQEERQTHRLMFLIFQWGFRDRRLVKREVMREQDLWLTSSERIDPTHRHILPEIYMKETGRQSTSLTPTRLLELGKNRAAHLEMDTDNIDQLINLGLQEASARGEDQLARIPPEQIQSMVKICLLGMNQGAPTKDENLIALVEERLIESIQKQLGRSANEFRHWMWEDFDNIVQQISQRRGGGNISRTNVRFVLCDLLWRAYEYMDNFVRLQMQAVRNRIKPALTSEELRDFGFWYEKQPWLGELAAVILHHRWDMTAPILTALQLAESDHDRLWRDHLQAMYWKMEMVENRRQADQLRKQRR